MGGRGIEKENGDWRVLWISGLNLYGFAYGLNQQKQDPIYP